MDIPDINTIFKQKNRRITFVNPHILYVHTIMITMISFIVMITVIFIMIMITKANTQERESLFVPSMHTSTIVCSALSPWSKTGAFYYPRWNN